MRNIWKHWDTTALALATLIVAYVPQFFPKIHIVQGTTQNLAILIGFFGLLFAKGWKK